MSSSPENEHSKVKQCYFKFIIFMGIIGHIYRKLMNWYRRTVKSCKMLWLSSSYWKTFCCLKYFKSIGCAHVTTFTLFVLAGWWVDSFPNSTFVILSWFLETSGVTCCELDRNRPDTWPLLIWENITSGTLVNKTRRVQKFNKFDWS